MTENADVKLARVEAKLDTLVSEVGGLRNDVKDFGARITKLEESTREAVPQVWRLRERVAELERETANLRLELERLRQDYERQRQHTGSRWWDVAKLALGPAIAAAVGFLMGRRG